MPRRFPPLIAAATLALALGSCKGDRAPVAADGPPADAEPTAAPVSTGPSVLLITLDTTRADRLGCYGNPQQATPHLDRMAAEGVLFRRAFAHTPLTIPSHTTIFTGQYPDRHGIRDNGDHFLGDEAVTLAERFRDAGYTTCASVGAYVTNRKWGFGQGFDEYFDHIPANYDVQGNVWGSERRGDAVVADLVGWLEQRGAEPFFAWAHLFDPHHPYTPPPPYDETYARRPYLGEIAFTDAQVGVLLDALERLGRLDDTAVVIAGDHGESFGNHGEIQHGIFVYNATMHVPLILRPAGGQAAVAIDEPVGLIDVAPTLVALAGLPLPDPEAFDGVDLTPTLAGSEPARRALYGESNYARLHYGWSEQRMIVEWPDKYIGSTRPELFDIEQDPTEQDDRIETRAADAARLAALIEDRPAHGSSAVAAVDADTARRLEALGYVASVVDIDEGAPLPDPKDKTGMLASFARARGAQQAGRLGEARELLETVIRDEPELVDPRLALAQLLMRQGRLDEAMAEVDAADRLVPGASRVLEVRAVVLAVGGDVDGAVTALEQALAVDDQQARTWGQLLQMQFETRRFDATIASAVRAEQAMPGIPAVAGYHGAALVALGRPDEARPLLDRALAGGQSPPWAHFAMGMLEAIDGDLETPLEHFLAEHAAYPEHLEALYSTVLHLGLLGRNEQVVEYAQLALKANPSHPDMHRALGQAQFNLRQYTDAEVSVDACLAINPEHADCMMLRANVLKKLGRDEEAEAAFQTAVGLAQQQMPDARVDGVRR